MDQLENQCNLGLHLYLDHLLSVATPVRPQVLQDQLRRLSTWIAQLFEIAVQTVNEKPFASFNSQSNVDLPQASLIVNDSSSISFALIIVS